MTHSNPRTRLLQAYRRLAEEAPPRFVPSWTKPLVDTLADRAAACRTSEDLDKLGDDISRLVVDYAGKPEAKPLAEMEQRCMAWVAVLVRGDKGDRDETWHTLAQYGAEHDANLLAQEIHATCCLFTDSARQYHPDGELTELADW